MSSLPNKDDKKKKLADALKENFKDKLENEDWRLVIKLKKVFNII